MEDDFKMLELIPLLVTFRLSLVQVRHVYLDVIRDHIVVSSSGYYTLSVHLEVLFEKGIYLGGMRKLHFIMMF